MSKFKVGDYVVASILGVNKNPSLTPNDVGVVLGYDYCGRVVSVDWGKNVAGGHDCSQRCKYGYGWNVREDEISLLAPNAAIDVNDYL